MVSKKAIGNFIINKRSIVPNFITMLNMTMGFFAIIYAGKGDVSSIAIAGVLVFIGSICDASDGAVARAMHVESPVGVQLDSLADGIAYGIAPAIIAYQGFLSKLPMIYGGIGLGMIIAPIYPICAIYRLARFNTCNDEKDGFNGLPSPAAGILVASIPALFPETLFFGRIEFLSIIEIFLKSNVFFVILYLTLGFLMVSNIDYSKLFSVLYKKGKIIILVALILMGISLVLFQMWIVFLFSLMYVAIGVIFYIIKNVTSV